MALRWALRCLPGLSLLTLFILTECALGIIQTIAGHLHSTDLLVFHAPLLAQVIFVAYSLFLHVLAFFFPLRLCYSSWQAAKAIRSVCGHGPRDTALFKLKTEESPCIQPEESDTEQQEQHYGLEIVHAIMIPAYREDVGLLEDTLKVLASHTLASRAYDVCSPSRWTSIDPI